MPFNSYFPWLAAVCSVILIICLSVSRLCVIVIVISDPLQYDPLNSLMDTQSVSFRLPFTV